MSGKTLGRCPDGQYVYPVEQFVDGRLAKGIAAINALIPNPRVAWLWLRRANPILGANKPIDLLKHGRVDEVLEAAQARIDVTNCVRIVNRTHTNTPLGMRFGKTQFSSPKDIPLDRIGPGAGQNHISNEINRS
ncbi:hypothetical protein AB4Z52_26280 [Rhizobium sp. 2YAF20]|uniref:hypothetical protein n=1 Tax=Rhizobium sp. 2YAF20 TaxID=3233027 RepID=UPI003F95DB5A